MKKCISVYIALLTCLFFMHLQAQSAPDFNGDGIRDLGHVWSDNGSLSVSVLESTGVSFTESKWVNQTGSYDPTQRWFYGDFNGDGLTDVSVIWDDSGSMSCDVYLSTDTNSDFIGDTFTKVSWATQSGPFNYGDRWFVGDFNGDFNADLARLYNDNDDRSIDVYLTSGSGFAAPSTWADRDGEFAAKNVILMGDFNGDFATDFAVVLDQDTVKISVHLANGNGFQYQTWEDNVADSRLTSMKWLSGDFNGDGITDIAKLWEDNGAISIDVHASSGASFAGSSWVSQSGTFAREHKWFVGDFNGDFTMDIARLWNDGGQMSVESYMSDGISAFTPTTIMTQGRPYRDQEVFFVGDYDGDFVDDIAAMWGDTTNWNVDVISGGFGFSSNFSSLALSDYFDRHNLVSEVNGDKFVNPNELRGATPPGADLQAVMDSGADLELIKQQVYNVNATLLYKADYQILRTYDAKFIGDYAIIRMQIDQGEYDHVIDGNRMSYLHIENITVDGNKYALGQKDRLEGVGQGAMVFFSHCEGIWVKRCVFYNTRTWSTCHLPSFGDSKNHLVENNYVLGAGNGPRGNGRDLGELGNNVPGGTGNTGWADAFSISAGGVTARENFLMDCTDVGIVLFGASGAHVHDNMIFNYSRECLGAINLVDASSHWLIGPDATFTPWNEYDYRNDIVEDNRITASGCRIQLGIPFGNRVWKNDDPAVFNMLGGAIRNNLFEGGAFGYGMVVDYVTNANISGNVSTATHSGKGRGGGINGNDPDPAVAFLYEPNHVTGSLQPEFVDAVKEISHLLYMNGTPYNADGYHYYPYTDPEIDATIEASFLEMLGRLPTAGDYAAYRPNFNYGTGATVNTDYIGDYLKRELMLLPEFINKFGAIPPETLHVFRTARWRDRIKANDESELISTGNYPDPKVVYDNVLTDLVHPGFGNLNAVITSISPSLPTYMAQGQAVNVSITVQNTGSETWVNTGSNPQKIALAAIGDDSTFGVTRYYLPEGISIPNGGTHTFNVTIAAPPVAWAGEGQPLTTFFPYDLRMIKESVSWFGESITDHLSGTHQIEVENAPEPPPLADYNSIFVSQEINIPGNLLTQGIQPGETFSVSVTFRNAGNYTSQPWMNGDFNLGSEGPENGQPNEQRDNFVWGTNRMNMDATSVVSHGEYYTFTKILTAPSAAHTASLDPSRQYVFVDGGVYNFQWQILGIPGWFGQKSQNVQIKVSSTTGLTVGLNDSNFVSVDAPQLVLWNNPYSVDVTFENTGESTWTAGTNFKIGGIESLIDRTSEGDAIITTQYPDGIDDQAVTYQGYGDPFDNNAMTKYYTENSSAWVQYQFGNGNQYTITDYAVVSAPDSGPGPEEVNNSSFESGSTGWSLNSFASITNAESVSGGSSLTFTINTGGNTGNTEQTITGLKDDTDYRLSFYMKQAPGSQGLFVLDTDDVFDETCQWVISGGFPTEWTPYSAVFNTGVVDVRNPPLSPNPGQIKLRIRGSSFTGTVYVDDVSIVEVGGGGDAGDPLSWTLEGSNNGSTWTQVDSRSGIDFPNRSQRLEFNVATPASYEYYRFNANNNSGSVLQFSELELLTGETDNIWSGENNVSVSSDVLPGAQHTFTLNLTAPGVLGDYNLQTRMLQENSPGQGWFGEYSSNSVITVTDTPPPVNNAVFTGQSGVPVVAIQPGAQFLATVTFQNTGNTTWSFSDPEGAYKMGTQNPQDVPTWGNTRIEMTPGDSVLPGESYTFDVIATAPATDGVHNFQWKMLQEGVQWFGAQSTNLTVTVDSIGGIFPAFDSSDFLSMTSATKVDPLETFNVVLEYTNNGTTTWDTAGGFGIVLDPAGAQDWTINSISMTDDLLAPITQLAPNATGFITVSVTAPNQDGVTRSLKLITDMNPGVGNFGEASNSVNITVSSNDIPSFNSSPIVKTVDNGSYTGSVAGDVTDDDTLSYNLIYQGGPGSEPDWLSIDTNGSLSGTIPATPGQYRWTLTVNDGNYGPQGETLIINVENWAWLNEYSGTHPNTLGLLHMNDPADRDDSGATFGLLNLTNTTGTMSGAGKFGTGLSNTLPAEWIQINGTEARPDALFPADSDPSISIEFWVNSNASGGGTQSLVGYRYSYAYEFQKRDNDTVRFYLRGNIGGVNNTDSVLDSSATLTPGVWHHVAGTWDARTNMQRLYIDGVEQPGAIELVDFVLEDAAGSKAIHLLNSWEQNRGANASMDEFRISDTAYVYGKTAEVPAIIGFDEAAAEAGIIAEGYVVGTKTYTYTRGVISGTVVGTTPAVGTQLPEGSAVDLEIQALADTEATISFNGLTDDNWLTDSNWAGGVAPTQTSQNLKVVFNVDGAPEAVLSSTADAKQMVIGDGGTATLSKVRLASGADLFVGQKPDGSGEWTAVGYNKQGELRVETGALMTIGQNLYIANSGGSSGSHLYLDGGTINVNSLLRFGDTGGIENGFLTINFGGQISANNMQFRSVGSVIDIRNGTLILTGDRTADVSTAIAAGNLLAAGGSQALSVDYDVTNSGKTTISYVPAARAIPNVVGQAEATAAATLLTADFPLGTVTYVYDNVVAAGNVMSQSPVGGTISVSDPVDLTVSLGIQSWNVPDVVGQLQATAEANIVAGDLSVGTVTISYQQGALPGTVISTNPIAGTSSSSGAPVDLVIQEGVGVAESTVVFNGSVDSDWMTAANWNGGVVPIRETQFLKTVFNDANAPEGVLSGTAAVSQLVIGDGGSTTHAQLRLASGANLYAGAKPDGTNVWTAVGYNKRATLVVETGATLTTADRIMVGNQDGGGADQSHLKVYGGTVNVGGEIRAGSVDGVTRGFITVAAGGVLTGNNLNLRNNGCIIDLREGTIILDGDETADVQAAITNSTLHAFRDTTTIQYDYNTTNLGKTTVTAVLPPAASVPNVVGLTQANAESSIILANFLLGNVTTASSDTVAAGSVISQTPTGGTSLVDAVIDLVISTGPDSLYAEPYDSWARANFTQGEYDGGLADYNLDPDNDGYTNFDEFTLGSNPKDASDPAAFGSPVSAPSVAPSGSDLVFTFPRAQAGLTYTVQISTDLVTWTDHVVNPGSAGGDVPVTLSNSLMVGGKLFVRLKVDE